MMLPGVMPSSAICATDRWFSITEVRTWVMSAMSAARPGRIKHEERIGFPHPRDYRLKTEARFTAHKAQLTEEIRVEAQRVIP